MVTLTSFGTRLKTALRNSKSEVKLEGSTVGKYSRNYRISMKHAAG
jgi:hypothetical protein